MESTEPAESDPSSPRLGVLISGGGRTLENLQIEIDAGRLNASIPIVIASRDDIGGLERCRRLGLRCEVLNRKSFDSTDAHSEAIFNQLSEANVDLVVMAGWLSLVTIPDAYQGRVLNIHPSLLPAFSGKGFYGHHVHEAAIRRGVQFSGCTVHFADPHYDEGPIVLQKVVPVFPEDDADSLAARVFEAECEAYPEAIRIVTQRGL